MVKCLIALGGNIGATEVVFRSALNRLERPAISVVGLSKVLSTRPVGASAGEEFLNAAAVLECDCQAAELLTALHEVEDHFGRVRTRHWGPRTLDLDLCLFGSEVIDTPKLVLPHPAMWYRRFVLDPSVEVASEMFHPILKRSINQLHQDLLRRPLRIALSSEVACVSTIDSKNLTECMQRRFSSIEWLRSSTSTTSDAQCFAGIVLDRADQKNVGRKQPPHEMSRLIRLSITSTDDASEQLTQLLAAMLG